MTQAILRLPALKVRTGLSRSTIYLQISEGVFPKPISLGPRAVGWLEEDIAAWIRGRIDKSRKHAGVAGLESVREHNERRQRS